MRMTPAPETKGYIEIPCPPLGIPSLEKYAYTRKGCNIIVSRDLYGGNKLRWHMSISRSDRMPNYEEVRDARYALVPNNVTMVMMFPPKEEWVNIHERCFHLHEIVE